MKSNPGSPLLQYNRCGFSANINKISLREYKLNTYYNKEVPIFLVKSDPIKLETYRNGIFIKVIDYVSNKLSEDVNYSINYLKTLPSVTTENSFNCDIIFNCYQYLDFLKKYDIEFKLHDIIVISGVPNLDNAYWNGRYLVFGSGCKNHLPLVSSCIVAHELTHALIQTTVDLYYSDQSGALNESFADIFGCVFEDDIRQKFHSLGWEIGSECNFKLRDMKYPNKFRQPMTVKDPLFYTGYKDNGGVHINSGVTNHIFVCFTEKIGLIASFNIFRKVLLLLDSRSDFLDFKRKMIDFINNDDLDKTLINIIDEHI